MGNFIPEIVIASAYAIAGLLLLPSRKRKKNHPKKSWDQVLIHVVLYWLVALAYVAAFTIRA
jgi:peptidoglycan biosynthesis protein MviN/MurJ (putative lipid II flippase)